MAELRFKAKNEAKLSKNLMQYVIEFYLKVYF